MSEVISLAKVRQQKDPHLEGVAICTSCKHRWHAIAPVGTMDLQCPECRTMRGVWEHGFAPDKGNQLYHCLTCNCTNYNFYRKKGTSETRILCVGCGTHHSIDSIFS